jgi:hypothetical protein
MRVWAVGLVVALMALGAAGGYLLGSSSEPEPTAYDGPSPIAAESPSVPVDQLELEEDPDFPPLLPGIGLRETVVGAKPFDLRLQVPANWLRTVPQAGEWRWYPPPGDVLNTYFLRVGLVGNQHQPVATMLEERIDALDGAEGVKDFVLESRSSIGFVANYVSEGHRRVAMEMYVAQPGSDVAFAWIALVGREVDREGMADLLARLAEAARTGPDYLEP